MKLRVLSQTFLVGIVVGLIGCNKGLEGTENEKVIRTADGVAIIDTFTIDATVSAIDPVKKTVTLIGKEGGKTTCTAGKNAVVFDKLKVGDSVTATLTQAMAVAIDPKGNLSPSQTDAAGVALATAEKQNDVFMAAATKVQAKVTAIDLKTRKVTLQIADGTTRTITVGKNVNLENVDVGNDVVFRVAESVALNIVSK